LKADTWAVICNSMWPYNDSHWRENILLRLSAVTDCTHNSLIPV
jgi:hypothetical protein